MPAPMTGAPFLRPYLRSAQRSRPPTALAQMHLRFYRVSRSLFSPQTGAQSTAPITNQPIKESKKPQRPAPPKDRTQASDQGLPGSLQHASIPMSVARLIELGRAPEFDPASGIPERDWHRRTINGRITSIRRQGTRLLFIDVVDGFQKLQVCVHFNTLCKLSAHWRETETTGEFENQAGQLQRGDFISVTGTLVTNKKGQFTLRASEMPSQLVTPAFIPPSSLSDDEVKARSRHLDLLANTQSLDILRARSLVLDTMRSLFRKRGFQEVQTPILAGHAGGAAATPFVTISKDLKSSQPLSLRVAPELWLKRLIVSGFSKVYEIGPCFRNEGLDVTHNPEFTMCEFYEAYGTLASLMSHTCVLMRTLIDQMDATSRGWISPDGQTRFRPWELPKDIAKEMGPKFEARVPQVPFIPTLEKALGFKLPDLESPTALDELITLLRGRGDAEDLEGAEQLTLPKLLDRLGGKYVESPLSQEGPVFVTHHPACMAPLARSQLCRITGQIVAKRAELFVNGGLELANMYEEEHDAARQEQKFKAARRLALMQSGEGAAAVDEADLALDGNEANFVDALRAGMPPTAGWGCGVDRLVMFLTGAPRIRDVLAFGNLRNVVSATRLEPGQEKGYYGEAGEVVSQAWYDQDQLVDEQIRLAEHEWQDDWGVVEGEETEDKPQR